MKAVSGTFCCRINLTFWEELAHVAHQHLEKGQQIYVSGRLVSDTVESEDGKQQTYYKVILTLVLAACFLALNKVF